MRSAQITGPGLLSILACASGVAQADTTQLVPNTFAIDQGVDFAVSSFAQSDFLFTWSDGTGAYTDLADPSLVLTAGETYTFSRTSGFHPFALANDTLPIDEFSGVFIRSTLDIPLESRLQPLEDFTADPAPTDDLITWTPTPQEVGQYYYVCLVLDHQLMAGSIQVVLPACPADVNGDTVLDNGDISAFVTLFLADDLAADFTGDGVLDNGDIGAFVASFLAGC